MIHASRELCSICGLSEATYRCSRCGRPVCRDDYDAETGMCLVCKATLCEICGRGYAIGYCMYCGRVGCEDCLIQVDPVRYVCRDCYRRRGGRYRLARDGLPGRKASAERDGGHSVQHDKDH